MHARYFAYAQLRIFMRFSTRARACPFLVMHLCACTLLSCRCSPLGNERPETKTRGSKERERRAEMQRKRRRKQKKKKKSKNRLVARIEFRTVSNDTDQDTTATMMVPGILLPLLTFPFFSTVKSHMSSRWNFRGDSQRSQVTRGWREHRELRDQRRITRLRVYLMLRDLVWTKYSSEFYPREYSYWQIMKEYVRQLRQVEKF